MAKFHQSALGRCQFDTPFADGAGALGKIVASVPPGAITVEATFVGPMRRNLK
jgi:hypothetical protein